MVGTHISLKMQMGAHKESMPPSIPLVRGSHLPFVVHTTSLALQANVNIKRLQEIKLTEFTICVSPAAIEC
jgi:hypothetical protein